jgi:hypothetical protein
VALNPRYFSATAVVVAGVVVAAVVGQLPAVGLERHMIVATPASAGQRLVCPGGAVAVGAAGQNASSLTAAGSPSRDTGTSGSGHTSIRRLGRGNVKGGTSGTPRLITAAADTGRTGAIAAAQSETVTTGDVAGLVATGCTVPVNTAWLVGGATTTGRTGVLMLANASGVPAEVAVNVWTENGPVKAANNAEVLVGPHSRQAVSLASIVPDAAGTAVQVVSTGGQLGVALEQRTVRGLESGGVDITGPTSAPATEQVIPGVRIAGAAAVASVAAGSGYADLAPVVRLLAPGARGADVRVRISGAAGGDRTLTKRIAAGVVTDLQLAGLGDGIYTVRVTSSEPVIAGARISVVTDPGASTTDTGGALPTDGTTLGTGAGTDGGTGTDAGLGGTDSGLGGTDSAVAGTDSGTLGATGTTTDGTASTTSTARGIDLAWIAAAQPLGASAAVAVADGPSPDLALTNSGTHAITVRVGGQAVTVPAGRTVSKGVQPGVLTLTGTTGIRAAVDFSGAGAIAAYPVAPADQAAHPVRVTH